MNYVKIVILFLTAALLLAACKKDETPQAPKAEEPTPVIEEEAPIELENFAFDRENFPRMDGSVPTVPLAQAVAAVVLGETRESVENLAMFTRTSQAYRNLASGQCDMLIAGEPAPGVLDEMAEQGFNVDMAPIATDALVFIVSASNPVHNLTTEQIVKIYTGEITNWQQVGGEDLEIAAFQRNEEAGSQVLMEKLVMDWQRMSEAPMQSFSDLSEPGDAITAIKGFNSSANAIGYTMFYYAEKMGMADGLKILSVDGVKPSTDSIMSGRYPFLNPYYVVISADEPEDNPARIMYNWLLSDDGQALIRSEGYVSIQDSEQAGPSPEMRWSVSTDDSGLTPYISPHSMHTRVKDGQMPRLVPSDSYGTILPYSSAVTMNDGSLRVSGYGLLTMDGVVITDIIYDSVDRAAYNTTTTRVLCPAYHLRVMDSEVEAEYGVKFQNAACALDGSWITGFDYADIVFTDKVIFLLRDYDTYDIDVYNYSGEKLYNIKELEWASDISEDTWAEMLVYNIREGYGFVKLNDDKYGIMDELTGDITKTEFVRTFYFSEGLAAVVPGGDKELWGFVNKELEFVIPPGFVYESAFSNGRAFVETPDGNRHIIDTEAAKLLSVTQENIIIQEQDGRGFSVFQRDGTGIPKLYTGDFTEIELPSDAGAIGPESSITYVGDGWYFLMTEVDMWLFTSGKAHRLPDGRDFHDFIDGFIIFIEYSEDYSIGYYGVMRPDGQDIIPSEAAVFITPAIENGTVKAFIQTKNASQGGFINETYKAASYRLIDLDGSDIRTGPGILSYDEALGLYFASGTDHFAWLDASGKTIISVPSMAYSFD